MAIRALRICDVCQTEYDEGNKAWMVMTAPNAPSEDGAGLEFDFCSFDCLHSWVTAPDEEDPSDEDEAEMLRQQLMQTAHQMGEQLKTEADDARTIAAKQPRPAVNLLEAVALGQKPGFDPLRDRGR